MQRNAFVWAVRILICAALFCFLLRRMIYRKFSIHLLILLDSGRLKFMFCFMPVIINRSGKYSYLYK